MSSDPSALRGRTQVINEGHSLGQTRADQPGNGPAIGTPVKMTGGIANAVDPATVHQPEALTKPLMLLEMGKRMYGRFVTMVGGEEAIAALLERKIGLHILLDAGGVRVHYRGRVWWVPESNSTEFVAIVKQSGTLDEIMTAMTQVAAPQVRYG
ncbi:MAG TPA: hypothetical protein VIC60_03595 [Thermomicrobiales bacterium]|jgi:hypothetical protein